jgi:hypothetical protein
MVARMKTIYCDGTHKLIENYQVFTILGRIDNGPAIALAVAMTNSHEESAYEKIARCLFTGTDLPIVCMTDMENAMRNGRYIYKY